MLKTFEGEELVDTNGAAELFPVIGGIPVTPGAVLRWTRKGCRGVQLEAVVVGGKVCTSHEAVIRFIERLTRRHTLLPVTEREPAS